MIKGLTQCQILEKFISQTKKDMESAGKKDQRYQKIHTTFREEPMYIRALQTANETVFVLRHDSVRVPHKDHPPQRRIRKSIKKKNRLRRDQGRPRETSCHEVKQETLEERQLGEIPRTAETIKENKSSEVYGQCNFCPKRSRCGTRFWQMWKEAWRIDSLTRKEHSSDN